MSYLYGQHRVQSALYTKLGTLTAASKASGNCSSWDKQCKLLGLHFALQVLFTHLKGLRGFKHKAFLSCGRDPEAEGR